MFARSDNGLSVSLRSILKNEWNGLDSDIQITSCTTDVQHIGKGSLFVSLAKEETVCVREIRKAVENGCQAILTSCSINPELSEIISERVPLFFVKNALDIFGRVCHALYGNPAQSLKLIGISGTSGKTSTSYLVAGMLAEAGQKVGLIGSLGIYDGEVLVANRETTPTPDQLAAWLNRMQKNGCSFVILEVSSIAIAEQRLAGLTFDAICMTNICRDHLDYHQTVEQYRRTKLQLFRYTNENTIAVCNADDRVSGAMLPLIDCPTLTTGMHSSNCQVSGMLVERTADEQTFYITAGDETAPVRTRIIGNQGIYNALMTVALGIAWGIDLTTAIRGIERVEHIPGRMERIDCGQPFHVYVDHANNPESLALALETLRQVTSGNIFCVLGTGMDGDRSKRPLMGRTAESLSDVVVLTANDQKNWDAKETFNDLLKGFSDPVKARRILRRKDALIWTLSNADVNDAVLIVGCDSVPGSGKDDMLNLVSDRDFVRTWLYDNQPCLESFWD